MSAERVSPKSLGSNPSIGHNAIPRLIVEIQEAHRTAQMLAESAVQHAVSAGQALIELKSLVAHGGWLPVLREAGLKPGIAQAYMRLARLGPNAERVAHLSLRRALREIAKR